MNWAGICEAFLKSSNPIWTGNRKGEQNSFYSKDIRRHFRLHPMKLSRNLVNLEKRGFIKLVSANRQSGYEYQIISWDDYETLKNNVDILDRIIEKLKQKDVPVEKQLVNS